MLKQSSAFARACRLLAISLCLAAPAAGLTQDQPVEYVATPLSGTVTMLQGSGGNVTIS